MYPSWHASSLMLALMAAPAVLPVSAEKVVGAYIFSRHGDRTAKVLKNTELTDLGYEEVYQSGRYWHDRYIDADSSLRIDGISDQVVKLSQITASSPSDDVLQNSALALLQGIYPPIGSAANETLADGSTVKAPLNGYQLIPLSLLDSGTDSEDNTWLQDATGCQNAAVSSNNYYSSALYTGLLDSTRDFYASLAPLLNSTFADDDMTFKNAYTIFDYLNVASIHNTSNTPSDDQLHQLLLLANIEQYNLAYNQTESVRAIAGSQLAGEVLDALNKTITSQGKSKLNIQLGSYGTFLSYFGLAQLPAADVNFTGIPDYASSMSWELVTDSTADGFPDAADINVRFLFHNGTIPADATPTAYALFNGTRTTMPWSEFVDHTKAFAITSDADWCDACGNSDGQCQAPSGSNAGDASAQSAAGGDGGVSRPVAGVIGAMVTLAVVLGLEALLLAVGGFRITKKQTASAAAVAAHDVAENKAASKA